MNPRAFIMQTADGAFSCDPVPIRDYEGTLRRYFANELRLLRNVFTVDDEPVDVAVGPHNSTCSVRLKKLSLSARFAQQGSFLVPTFRPADLALALEWTAPPDMDLRFAATCGPCWDVGECLLFTRGQRGFLKLPLPNVYEDGRVCMGDRVGTIRGDTLEVCFKKAVETFRATTWNSDLFNHPAAAAALFRWNPDRSPVPCPADWQRNCQAVSRPEMEALCPA